MKSRSPLSADKCDLIFLVGFMGTGKTHWGKIWAQVAGYTFMDLDMAIESSQRCAIAEIFANKGEEYFRNLEAETLRELKGKSRVLVACGGGTPCFFDNMKWMNENGTTVWLKADPATIVQNIRRQPGTRPLVQNMTESEMVSFVTQKLQEREPFYSKASITVASHTLNDTWLEQILLSNN